MSLALLIGPQTVTAHNPAADTLVVPVAPAPTFDGNCTNDEYADAMRLTFTSRYGTSNWTVEVFVKRDLNNLYVCYHGLPKGDSSPGDFVALYIDREHDGGRFARSDDFQLRVGQNGTVEGHAGDDVGGYTGASPSGWTVMRRLDEFTWNAEFRVSETMLGGWGKSIGVSFAHHWVRFVGNDYAWPSGWGWNSPDTWAHFGLDRTRVVAPEGTTPILDGSCGSTEYQDAARVTFVSAYATAPFNVTVYLKHDWANAYLCFSGLPRGLTLPGDFASVYIDRNHDLGVLPRADDYWLRISQTGHVAGQTGNGASFSGPDPGSWTAQSSAGEFFWDAEFRIARNLVGGWGHDAGLSLWHQSVRRVDDDYGWPTGAETSKPDAWGDVVFEVASTTIGVGSAPTLDGRCDYATEYGDATSVQFVSQFRSSSFPVNVYLKHTDDDLYVCFSKLPRGDPSPGDFATVYLDRDHDRGAHATSDDFALSIKQDGTRTGGSGDGSFGYGGAEPGGWTAQRHVGEFFWDAEFRISRTVVGGWGRTIGLSLFHHWVRAVGDDYHWPAGGLWNAPNSWAHAVVLTTSALADNDLQITDIEVTQAIQDLTNSVPLVAGKRTVVRVHVRADRQLTHGVSARLYGRRGGVELGPGILPSNAGASITALTNPDRGQLNDGFYFDLPWTWTQTGTLDLEARINPSRTLPERDYDNNSRAVSVTFSTTPPLRLKLVAVRYQKGGATWVASDFHQNMLINWLNRAYPIPYVYETLVTRDFPPTAGDPTSDRVNSWLGQMRSLDLAAGGDPRVVYYGMVDDGPGFMRGAAQDIPSSVASGPTGKGDWGWDFDGSYGDWYGGHEIGHTRGRSHAEFCGAGGGQSYPYPNGHIGPTGGTLFGFDVERHLVYPPTWTDVMTYCSLEWMSDFTYKGIRDYLLTYGAKASETPPRGEFLAVFGEVNLTRDTARLDTLYRLSNPTAVPERIPSEYVIRLLNARGSTLAEYPFTPLRSSDPNPGDVIALINEVVPYSAQTQRIVIMHGAREMAARNVSSHAPTVHVLSPNGGETLSSEIVSVRWEASDLDGDRLTYTVQYSRDAGTTWTTLATSLASPTVDIAVAELPGSQQALVRVLASDGVNTGQDQSDETFRVVGKPPRVMIASPTEESTFVQGQAVVLQGSATDLEDGTLADSSLRWSSSLDGDLGPGRTTALLSAGRHALTLTAIDSDGQSTSIERTVTIQAKAEIPPKLLVSPMAVRFTTEAGTSPTDQTISLRDQAGSEARWTAATNQPWLALQPASGDLPGALTVKVTSRALMAGTYEGRITIHAGPGMDDTPQTVAVVLEVTPAYQFRVYLPMVQRNLD